MHIHTYSHFSQNYYIKLRMPKKFQGENSKATASRARKTEAKTAEREREEQAKEDAYWRDDDKNVQRKTQRKNEQEQKRQQEMERKQANKQMYEQELNTLAANKQKQQQTTKVTQAQIERERQLEEMRRKEVERERLLEQRNIVVSDESEVLQENVNRMAIEEQSARTVEEAISVLKQTTEPQQQQDRHPEKRVRAAYTAFEERRLVELKQEKPTLRLSQLKQLVKREWMKSTENPLNQQIISIVQQQ